MAKLDRGCILDEAMDILASEGEPALAMRPLAKRLGVSPMALYRHFRDREALLVALVERVSEEIDLPGPAPDPRTRAVELALCLHDFLVAHPWLIRLIATGRLASPAGLQFPDGFLDAAARAGLGGEESFVFYRTIFAAVLGQASMTHAKRCQGPDPAPHGAAEFGAGRVAELAGSWATLDEKASPRRVFESVACLLPSEG
ncbi:TetR/AcrR family transcriptional regulator [Corynebacterium otitidis]